MSENNTRSEVSRADHLFYVTLKYTRTADVIKSIVNRLISALDSAIIDFLTSQKVKDIPKTGVMKTNYLKKNFGRRKNIKEIADFYNLLLKIDKSQYKVREEYRKNVAIETSEGLVNIERLKEFFESTKDHISYLYSTSP